MGKSGAARQQTGRVGQLLFVAQQAAQALAIERLEPLGLSPRAWGVLSTVAESGPLTQIELANTMAIDRTAMVYLLDDLEQQALVQRIRSPQDRRAFLIHLTPGGRNAQRRAAAALDGAAETLLAPLDEAERRHLVDLLATIAAHWQQPSATQPQPSAAQPQPSAIQPQPSATQPQPSATKPPRTKQTAPQATGNQTPASPRASRRPTTPQDRQPRH